MSIKSPETYGEQFWQPQLEVQKEFEEQLEESLKSFIPNIFGNPEIRAAMPFDVLGKIEGLLSFPHPGLASVGGRFVSEIADQAVSMIMTPALRKVQYAANRAFANVMPSTEMAASLNRRKRIDESYYDDVFRRRGYDPFNQQMAFLAGQPFPSLPELFRWARYHGDPKNVWSTLFDYVNLDAVDYPKWDWLNQQQLTFEHVNTLYKRGLLNENTWPIELGRLGWAPDKINSLNELIWSIPNAMLILQGNLHREEDNETILRDLSFGDIHPEYREKYIDAVLTKPASQDLIRYHLRQENRLENLETDLKRIGIHPDYLDVYKTLAHPLPPVSDLITMAVREAFSPAVARRFGQFEDFPEDFAKYAEQGGLSREWAQRYWAAHWNLPSPQQGFAMLHRGVITDDELSMLLRAQDVMPFWRDRLIQIAYKPFTRVDVRRMYKEGVLDEREIYKAYLDQGYDEENAEHLTEFTIKQTLSSLAKFTSTDVIKAFVQRMIDYSEASSLLRELGIKSEDTQFILRTAEYKRKWDFTGDRITAIRNLYKRSVYDENKARSELLKLNLPANQVMVLMESWFFEEKEKERPTWSRAETLKFIKSGAITKDRGIRELELIGYDQEHIDVYMESIV